MRTTITRLAGPFRHDFDGKPVVAGRVACALSETGDTDVDRCYGCTFLKNLWLAEDEELRLQCRTPPRPPIPAPH
jgi:hypothetical protein